MDITGTTPATQTLGDNIGEGAQMGTKERKPVTQLRVSQIIVQLVLLNEHDAPIHPDQLVFHGDPAGTAPEKLAAWLTELPGHLAAASETPLEDPVT